MLTFTFIEDYLEVLAGYREITEHGNSPGLSLNFFASTNSGPISLARYDVTIVHSMAGTTIMGKSLTDRQSELAIRLVHKYQRQFASKGVDVTLSVQNPLFRQALRLVDRTRSAFLRNDCIIVKFLYDKELVQMVSSAAKESKGSFKFDRELKEWQLAITEHNVNWVNNLTNHGFVISPEITNLMQLVLDCEQTDYRIELELTGNNTTITNAEPSLTQYVEDKIGGFAQHNLINLVDASATLGYTVSSEIQALLAQEFNPVVTGLLLNRDSHYMRNDPNSNGLELLEPLIEYVTLTNRWPIYIYEPDGSNYLRDTAKQLFAPTEFYEFTDKKDNKQIDLTGFKCVYFHKLKKASLLTIPILVSTNAMLFGGAKQTWLLTTQKVVYYTATTYNQETTPIASKTNN